MRSYYIYYRVADAAAAATLVRDLQSALRAETGVVGRVLKKRGEAGLWMEVYEDVGDAAGFERVLSQLVARLEFQRVLAPGATRKLECFEPA